MDIQAALKILGLKEPYTEKQLLDAYRFKAKIYHPDNNINSTDQKRTELEEKMKLINLAHTVLKNALLERKKESVDERLDFYKYRAEYLRKIKINSEYDYSSSQHLTSNKSCFILYKLFAEKEHEINERHYDYVKRTSNYKELKAENLLYERNIKNLCKDFYDECVNSMYKDNFNRLEKDEYKDLLSNCCKSAYDIYNLNTTSLKDTLNLFRDCENRFFQMLLNVKIEKVISEMIDKCAISKLREIYKAKEDFLFDLVHNEFANHDTEFISDKMIAVTFMSVLLKYSKDNLANDLKRQAKIKRLKEIAKETDRKIDFSIKKLYNMSDIRFDEYFNYFANMSFEDTKGKSR